MKQDASDLLVNWFENLVGTRAAFILFGIIAAGGFLSWGLYIISGAELTISYRRMDLNLLGLPARLAGVFLSSIGIFLHACYCWFSEKVVVASLLVQRSAILCAGVSLVAAIFTHMMR